MTKLYLKIAKTVQALWSCRHLARALEKVAVDSPQVSDNYRLLWSKWPEATALCEHVM